MNDPIFINLEELAGVDSETFAAADRGDRQAQKVMLRNLLTRRASAAALTTKDWMHWVLRGIATGTEDALGDALGSIAEAGRNGVLTEGQTQALNVMYEQYFGPEEVGEPASGNALAAFEGQPRPLAVVRLFLLADKLASALTPVTIDEIQSGVRVADQLQSAPAKGFFTAVMAQYLANESPPAALDRAMEAVGVFSELAASDDIYKVKLGQTVYLASQITEIAGEPQAGLLLRAAYADAVEAFKESQQ
jgi:hypothetical protein